ncbi:MAG: hypothetical protein U0Q11_16200 [Vicinamibacterales bacterium]
MLIKKAHDARAGLAEPWSSMKPSSTMTAEERIRVWMMSLNMLIVETPRRIRLHGRRLRRLDARGRLFLDTHTAAGRTRFDGDRHQVDARAFSLLSGDARPCAQGARRPLGALPGAE